MRLRYRYQPHWFVAAKVLGVQQLHMFGENLVRARDVGGMP